MKSDPEYEDREKLKKKSTQKANAKSTVIKGGTASPKLDNNENSYNFKNKLA